MTTKVEDSRADMARNKVEDTAATTIMEVVVNKVDRAAVKKSMANKAAAMVVSQVEMVMADSRVEVAAGTAAGTAAGLTSMRTQ